MNRNIARILGLLVGLVTAQTSLAATTTLTFDEYPDNTVITNQYQSVGVISQGVSIIDSNYITWPANSSPNVAIAFNGLMNFNLNPAIIGNVQSVSAYISGNTSVGIYAYDATGALVGQSATSGAAANALVSVTSSGSPITSVAIHDGGSSFVIDNLKFVSVDDVPACVSITAQLASKVQATPLSSFRVAKNAAAELLQIKRDIAFLQSMMATNAPSPRLYLQLTKIYLEIGLWMKPSVERNQMFDLMNQIFKLISKNSC